MEIERLRETSSKPFGDVLGALEAAVGRPDCNAFREQTASAKTFADVGSAVEKAIGPSGFMEFARFDLGGIMRKESGGKAPQILRLVIGDPLIMKEMVKRVPEAGSYAPVGILIDERRDGVRLSYDRMASFVAPYGNPEALKVAEDLDSKVESLLMAAAA